MLGEITGRVGNVVAVEITRGEDIPAVGQLVWLSSGSAKHEDSAELCYDTYGDYVLFNTEDRDDYFAEPPCKVIHTPISEDPLDQLLSYGIKQAICTHRLETVGYKYPDGWWQATKEKFLPEFLKRRAPVRYKQGWLKARVLYPRVPLKDQTHFMQLSKTEVEEQDEEWYPGGEE